MAKQINVRLDDSEHDLLLERAAEWGVRPTEYAKLQMLAPASDWGMRRLELDEGHLRAKAGKHVNLTIGEIMAKQGFAQLGNGWWKQGSDSHWVKVIPRG